MKKVDQVLVVGGGSAGFMAALALKIKLPQLQVTVIRSPEIGIIGVGEGSTPTFIRFVHQFLQIPISDFVRATQPGLKTGTCFLWGPKPHFYFPFGLHMAMKPNALPKPIGYYLDHGDAEAGSPNSARMRANRPFEFNPRGSLAVHGDFAYHIENDRFATYLETKVRSAGIAIIDQTIAHVHQDDDGVTALQLSDGRSVTADLYVDSSGFRSLLLGKTFGEPRVDYKQTLFCDRAVVGGWSRPAETPMLSYTVSETMDGGWCWRIDHPDRINRGYVYSSAFMSDEAAEKELRAKNPLMGPTRIVKFVSGRFERAWVKNVIAIGNASGFVEPLEATSLAITATRCHLLVDLLVDSDGVVSPSTRKLFNFNTAAIWDASRDFLSLHYRFNTRLDTPFWRHCREHVYLGGAEPIVEYFRETGPTPALAAGFVDGNAIFGVSSHLAILSGLKVASNYAYRPTAAEMSAWEQWCRHNSATAQTAATVEQSLAIIGGGRQLN